MLQGAGAGAKPTASAMVSDMIQLLQKMHNENQQKPFVKASFTSIEEISFEYFLEFTVNDKVGVLESVSHLFSQHLSKANTSFSFLANAQISPQMAFYCLVA